MWTPELVWERIVAAAETEKALPDSESRFRVAHSGSWPSFPDSPEEAYGYGDFRVRVSPSMGSIDGASEVWRWLRWIPLKARKAVFLLAAGVPARRVARKLRVSRTAVFKMKRRGIDHISQVLNK
jgi:hypothetical protein